VVPVPGAGVVEHIIDGLGDFGVLDPDRQISGSIDLSFDRLVNGQRLQRGTETVDKWRGLGGNTTPVRQPRRCQDFPVERNDQARRVLHQAVVAGGGGVLNWRVSALSVKIPERYRIA
jgi:hypothetical protein